MNKYREEQTLKAVSDYIARTYAGHYANDKDNTQTLDLIASQGLAEGFCQGNIIKYASRFGKKNGRNKNDLLKVIHYAILLYHFAGCHDEGNGISEFS